MKIDVLTATGQAVQISKTEKDFEIGISLSKNRHPYLNKFLESNDTILFRFEAENYFYVTHLESRETAQYISSGIKISSFELNKVVLTSSAMASH